MVSNQEKNTVEKVWFWQLIVSPHMAGLAKELAELEVDVVYVAQREMSEDRAKQGWEAPPLGKAELKIASTTETAKEIAVTAPSDAIHICQGIRGNGQIKEVQKTLSKLKRKQWVVMETVDDSGWRGVGKRLIYSYLFRRMRQCLQGVLATGRLTPHWVVARGVDKFKVFPFAYFLPETSSTTPPVKRGSNRFRLLFVGQFIELKRLGFLVDAIASIKRDDVEFAVIGSGPLEDELRSHAESQLPGRVEWIGRLPINDVRQQMVSSDCLVLPSRHDGWGAVVSEALMAGTPVICSDNCGSADVVIASQEGGVFTTNSMHSLSKKLCFVLRKGRVSDSRRNRIADWANCLGARSGAAYLKSILELTDDVGSESIDPPWIAR